MVAPELMRAAVTADYSAECLSFLRSGFDIDDPDPATVLELVRGFDARMRSLFVEGFILSGAAPSQGDDGVCQKTASQMVFDEIEFPEPFLPCCIRYGLNFECCFRFVGLFVAKAHSCSCQDLLWESDPLP